MLNLILGKPKLDFYLEIALAHLPQLEFKVCEIAPQAGFLRFLQRAPVATHQLQTYLGVWKRQNCITRLQFDYNLLLDSMEN